MADPQTIIILAARELGFQPWWLALHSMINASYRSKYFPAYPPTWTRLHSDPAVGAERMAEELGPNGYLTVILQDQAPIACAGVLPCRGTNWINHVESAEDFGLEFRNQPAHATASSVADKPQSSQSHSLPTDDNSAEEWEICCFCVRPDQRGLGLSDQLIGVMTEFIRSRGAKRLLSNYVIEETGVYWPKKGFKTIPGAGGMLKKGYTHTVGMEGLRADIHFAMGVKEL